MSRQPAARRYAQANGPLIAAAASALATCDALGTLNRVAVRSHPPALALRGIALAQLGDLPRSAH